jgi:hypothetical protein
MSQAKNESETKKKLAAKSGFGNFLPKPDLAAKFFGLSMISTNSASSDCQNHFWLPNFFLATKSGFSSQLPT